MNRDIDTCAGPERVPPDSTRCSAFLKNLSFSHSQYRTHSNLDLVAELFLQTDSLSDTGDASTDDHNANGILRHGKMKS